MFLENVRIALKSILSNKMRSFLTTLGILIGVCSVITIVALVQGIFGTIEQQIKSMGTDIITIQPYIQYKTVTDYLKNMPELTLDDAKALKKSIPGVGDLAPIVFMGSEVKWKDVLKSSTIYGAYPEYQDINGKFVGKGRFLTATDLSLRKRVCVIGVDILEAFGDKVDIIGKSIIINKTPFKVIGIMEKQPEIFGRSFDDYIFIPFTTALDSYGKKLARRCTIQFNITELNKLQKIKSSCKTVLRKRHKIKDKDVDDFRISTQEEILKDFSKTTGVITLVVAGIVGISLLVGGIGIMNIMLVTVTERTKEIGLRKAVGATKKNILSQFLIEAITLSFLGGLLGIVAGIVAGIAISKMIPNFPDAKIPISAIFLAFGFSAGVGVVFGVFPAAKASNLDPIDALRHE